MVRFNPVGNPVRTSTVSDARGASRASEGTPAAGSQRANLTRAAYFRDGFEPARLSPPPVRLASAERSSGQRERALEVTRQAPPGSVGAVIRPILETAMSGLGGVGFVAGLAASAPLPGLAPWVAQRTGAMAREFAAGRVGEFYEQQRELLNRPATDANIQEFSRRETDFFRTQPGAAGVVGGAVSADQRAALITLSRDSQRARAW